MDPGLLTKEWFRKYRSSEKLAFITLLCVCDEIGVWTIDVEWAEMLTGCRVDWKALVEGSNGNIIILDERHVLIPDYFRFQYPRASRNNPVWAKLYKKADDSPHRQLLSLPNLQTVDTSVVSQSPIPRYQGGTSVVRKEEEKEKVSLSSGVREDSSGDVGEEGVEPSSPASSGLDRGWMKEVVGRLNEKAGTAFKADTDQTVRFLKARAAEGFVVEDFLLVIDFKVGQWRSDPEMAQYLRPSTLFSPKFEGYLQAARNAVVEEEHAQQKREEQRRPTGNQATPRSW